MGSAYDLEEDLNTLIGAGGFGALDGAVRSFLKESWTELA